MPITSEQIEHNILVVTFDGKCPVDDISKVFLNNVFPLCDDLAPDTMHILYDITKLDWTFSEFVAYLNSVKERRAQNIVPENISQYFLGTNEWADSLRDWLLKQYGMEMGFFTELDSALKYIHLQTNIENET